MGSRNQRFFDASLLSSYVGRVILFLPFLYFGWWIYRSESEWFGIGVVVMGFAVAHLLYGWLALVAGSVRRARKRPNVSQFFRSAARAAPDRTLYGTYNALGGGSTGHGVGTIEIQIVDPDTGQAMSWKQEAGSVGLPVNDIAAILTAIVEAREDVIVASIRWNGVEVYSRFMAASLAPAATRSARTVVTQLMIDSIVKWTPKSVS